MMEIGALGSCAVSANALRGSFLFFAKSSFPENFRVNRESTKTSPWMCLPKSSFYKFSGQKQESKQKSLRSLYSISLNKTRIRFTV